MSIEGNWTLHFSWGCTGNYQTAVNTLNADGTFTYPGGSGRWYAQDGMINWQYDGGSTVVYSGSIQGNAMVGIMNQQGCWYAIKQGSTVTKFVAGDKDAISQDGK